MNKESTKKIGLWNIVGLGVGGAVGSGIFVTLGSAIARTFHSANHNHLRFLHATGLLVQSGNVRHLHYRGR